MEEKWSPHSEVTVLFVRIELRWPFSLENTALLMRNASLQDKSRVFYWWNKFSHFFLLPFSPQPHRSGIGPQIVSARHSCLLCCLIMQDSSDALLQAEAINCLQRLHMFAAQHAHPVRLLPELQVRKYFTRALSLLLFSDSFLNVLCLLFMLGPSI